MTSLLGLRGVGGRDENLSAPEVTLVSAQDSYPPVFSIIIPTEINVEIADIRMQVARDLAFAGIVHDQTIPVGTGPLVFSDLASITSGEYYYKFFFEQVLNHGASSTILKHGDTTNPRITSHDSASAIEGATKPTIQFTADEDVTWAVTGGRDAGLVSFGASGLATIDGTTDYYFGQRSYVFDVTATDYAGNASVPQTFTYTVLADLAFTPPLQLGWRDFDKGSAITISGTPPLTASTGGGTNPSWVRCLLSEEQSSNSAKFQVEYAVEDLSGGVIYFFGVDHGTDDLSTYRFMGSGGGYHGIVVQVQDGAQYYNVDEAGVDSSGVAIAAGDIIGIRVDKAGSAEFYRMRSGAYTTMKTISFTPFGGAHYANLGIWGGSRPKITVNLGGSSFARALSAGYTRY